MFRLFVSFPFVSFRFVGCKTFQCVKMKAIFIVHRRCRDMLIPSRMFVNYNCNECTLLNIFVNLIVRWHPHLTSNCWRKLVCRHRVYTRAPASKCVNIFFGYFKLRVSFSMKIKTSRQFVYNIYIHLCVVFKRHSMKFNLEIF